MKSCLMVVIPGLLAALSVPVPSFAQPLSREEMDLAELCRELSRQAYREFESQELPPGVTRLDPPIHDSKTGLDAALFQTRHPDGIKVYVLAFAGTEHLNDVLSDVLQGLPDLRKNVGIEAQYAKALELTFSVRDRARREKAEVVVTGHSLGGAIGQYVAAETGFKAILFNSSALGENTLNSIRPKLREQAQKNILHFAIAGDPVFFKTPQLPGAGHLGSAVVSAPRATLDGVVPADAWLHGSISASTALQDAGARHMAPVNDTVFDAADKLVPVPVDQAIRQTAPAWWASPGTVPTGSTLQRQVEGLAKMPVNARRVVVAGVGPEAEWLHQDMSRRLGPDNVMWVAEEKSTRELRGASKDFKPDLILGVRKDPFRIPEAFERIMVGVDTAKKCSDFLESTAWVARLAPGLLKDPQALTDPDMRRVAERLQSALGGKTGTLEFKTALKKWGEVGEKVEGILKGMDWGSAILHDNEFFQDDKLTLGNSKLYALVVNEATDKLLELIHDRIRGPVGATLEEAGKGLREQVRSGHLTVDSIEHYCDAGVALTWGVVGMMVSGNNPEVAERFSKMGTSAAALGRALTAPSTRLDEAFVSWQVETVDRARAGLAPRSYDDFLSKQGLDPKKIGKEMRGAAAELYGTAEKLRLSKSPESLHTYTLSPSAKSEAGGSKSSPDIEVVRRLISSGNRRVIISDPSRQGEATYKWAIEQWGPDNVVRATEIHSRYHERRLAMESGADTVIRIEPTRYVMDQWRAKPGGSAATSGDRDVSRLPPLDPSRDYSVYKVNNEFNKDRPSDWITSHSFLVTYDKKAGKVLEAYSFVNTRGGQWEDPLKPQNLRGGQAAVDEFIRTGRWTAKEVGHGPDLVEALRNEYAGRSQSPAQFAPWNNCKVEANHLLEGAMDRVRASRALDIGSARFNSPTPGVGGVMLHGVARVEGNDRQFVDGDFSLVFREAGGEVDVRKLRMFVTAAWAVYFGEEGPGISIDPIAPNVDKHLVRYIGMVINSDLGRVMRETDYLMKKWAVGTESPGIDGFKNVDTLESTHGEGYLGASRRFWFIPQDLHFRLSGGALLFQGGRMRLCTEYVLGGGSRKAEKADEAFAEFFSDHYPEIAAKFPVFAELFEYAKMVYLARYLKDSGVPMSAFLLANKDMVLTEDSPGTVNALVKPSEFREYVTIVGGVDLAPKDEPGRLVIDVEAARAIRQALDSVPRENEARKAPARIEEATAPAASAAPPGEAFTVNASGFQGLARRAESLTMSGGSGGTGELQTDLAIRIGKKPFLELVRMRDSSALGGEFGPGWRVFRPFQVQRHGVKMIQFRNAKIPEAMDLVNLVSGSRQVLTFSDSKYAIVGYVPPDDQTDGNIGLFVMADLSYRLVDRIGNEFHFAQDGEMREMQLGKDFGMHYIYGFESIDKDYLGAASYLLKPADEATVEVGTVRLPERMRFNDVAAKEEIVFVYDKANAAGLLGYKPLDSASPSSCFLGITVDGRFRLETASGWQILFDGAGHLVEKRRPVLKALEHGNYRLELDYQLQDGSLRAHTARVMKRGLSAAVQIVNYHYQGDSLSRVIMPGAYDRLVGPTVDLSTAMK
jgi:hypothetical protein